MNIQNFSDEAICYRYIRSEIWLSFMASGGFYKTDLTFCVTISKSEIVL